MSSIALAQLGEIARLQAGVGFPVDLQGRSSGDYPFAKVGDISRVGRSGEAVISGADHYIDEDDLARLKARPIPPGSVLFAKIGEAIRHNHRVIAGCPLLVDNNAMAAIPTGRVESRYLFHFLRSVDFYGLTSATTVPALRKSELERLPVPLPPLDEQNRIAEILDKADALRAKRRVALAHLDTLTQSIFLDTFGDPATNPKGWPIREFDGTMRDETARSKRLPQSAFLSAGLYPVVDQGQSLIAGYFDDERYLCQSALPVIVFGDHTRVVKLIPNPFVVGADGAKVLVPHPGVEANYLSWLLRTLPIPNLGYSRHMREVKRMIFPIPPIELQQQFAKRIGIIDRQRVYFQHWKSEIDALFASLQHRAFRGDL